MWLVGVRGGRNVIEILSGKMKEGMGKVCRV